MQQLGSPIRTIVRYVSHHFAFSGNRGLLLLEVKMDRRRALGGHDAAVYAGRRRAFEWIDPNRVHPGAHVRSGCGTCFVPSHTGICRSPPKFAKAGGRTVAADVTGVPTILIARTDANSAGLLLNDIDRPSRSFSASCRPWAISSNLSLWPVFHALNLSVFQLAKDYAASEVPPCGMESQCRRW
jgi:hypothetical protein